MIIFDTQKYEGVFFVNQHFIRTLSYSDPYARSGDYISIAVGPQLRLQVMSELPAGR